MITAPFTYPEAHMGLATSSTAWPRHFSPSAAIHKCSTTIPTPSDHVHYVQSHAQRNNPTSVLAALDRFAATTNPSTATSSSSLNPKAELIIDEVLLPFTPSHCPTASAPLVMLEPLGASSLGYSAILFASVLAARFGRANVRYIALDTDPERAHAAQQIVKHAGLADLIHVALGSVRERADEILGRVDLVLLMKPEAEAEGRWGGLDVMYMEAMWRLMEAGKLVKGSSVIADNMMDPGAPEYGRWAETHQGLESRRYEMVMSEGVDEEGDDEVDAVEVSVVL